ncbi:MAG: ATP-binding protein [Spirochaetia bacterium]|nr:ATP-binding protein [Spirochaetia bacterium]
MERPKYSRLYEDLARDGKIVILSGPRQAGKTTFARDLAVGRSNTLYFNYDSHKDRKIFLKDPNFYRGLERKNDEKPFVILDEIHKFRGWKSWLKGVSDTDAKDYDFLVTGSGRLEKTKRAGDALTGRYVSMRFFPFTLGELGGNTGSFADFLKNPLQLAPPDKKFKSQGIWEKLDQFSGFPEPFLKGEASFWRRWTEGFAGQIVRDDIASLEGIRQIDRLSLLIALLPSRVGSPLSQSNLASDLGVSFDAIKAWMEILESFFLVFKIDTYTKKISRSILKEKKYYLFNAPDVEDPGARFENLCALELVRSVQRANDLGEGRYQVKYLRNKEKEEVDFLITEKDEPRLLVEAKKSEDSPSPNLLKFQRVLNVPAVQLVEKKETFRLVPNGKNEVLVSGAHRWCAGLP